MSTVEINIEAMRAMLDGFRTSESRLTTFRNALETNMNAVRSHWKEGRAPDEDTLASASRRLNDIQRWLTDWRPDIERRLALAEQIAGQLPEYKPGDVVTIDESLLFPGTTNQAAARAAQIAEHLTLGTMTDQDLADLKAYLGDSSFASAFLRRMRRTDWEKVNFYPTWLPQLYRTALHATGFQPDLCETVMVEFGLDPQAAASIQQLTESIDARYRYESPAFRAYITARLLGGFEYNDWKWKNTAGFLKDHLYSAPGTNEKDEAAEICERLGLSADQVKHMKEELDKQHFFSGFQGGYSYEEFVGQLDHKTDRSSDSLRDKIAAKAGLDAEQVTDDIAYEWYSRMANKGDFTHQMITTSVELDSATVRLADGAGDRRSNSGWAGDVTYRAGNPSMNNGDYKADLDAVGIAANVQSGNSLQQAMNRFYTGLEKNDYTRAEEFLKKYSLFDVETMAGGQVVGKNLYIEPTEASIHFVNSLKANSNEYLGS